MRSLGPSELEAASRAAVRELCRRRFHRFVREAWPHSQSSEFIDGEHIRLMCDHYQAVYEGRIRRLVVNIPPGCSKSVIAGVMFPAWAWTRDPAATFFFASYSLELSTRDSVFCRYLIESPWYRSLWGSQVQLADDQDRKTMFATKAGGWRMASSVGGRGTGEHPRFIFGDDVHKALEAESDAERHWAIEWWDGTMSTRGEIHDSRRVLLGQRIHQQDLYGHALATGDYEHLCLPMEYDPARAMRPTSIGGRDWRSEPGELLWPAVFNREKVTQIRRALGSRAAAQFDQAPTPPGGLVFRRSDFCYATLAPSESVRPPYPASEFRLSRDDGRVEAFAADRCQWFQTVDTALKIKKHNDYTVVGTFAVTPAQDLIVVDVARERLEVPQQLAFLRAQRAKWPCVSVQAVEDAASGTGLIQQSRVDGLPLATIRTSRDKVENAQPLATAYQSHKVYHLSGADWLGDFEGELLAFPRGAHDDQVDVAANAERMRLERADRRIGIHAADPAGVPSARVMIDQALGRVT